VFQPRVSVVVRDEGGIPLRGRVGVRRLDPETAVAGPMQLLGELPLEPRPAPSGHIRLVVEVDGRGLLEFTRYVRSGASVPLDLVARAEQGSVADMVRIEGARCTHRANPSSPLQGKTLDIEPFWLDRCEVSIREYREFLDVHPMVEPPPYLALIERGSSQEWLPIVDVSWEEARAFAEWRGKRLPSHAEWMLAARGPGMGRTWPWGEEGPERANANSRECTTRNDSLFGYFAFVRPVRSFQAARSVEGVFHLFGNVMEWTESHHSERGPTGEVRPDYERRILCGSAWDGATRGAGYDLTVYEHWGTDWKSRYMSRGFRCARSASF
jgi:formylglycine-generating enzyme required for sulfatase activity